MPRSISGKVWVQFLSVIWHGQAMARTWATPEPPGWGRWHGQGASQSQQERDFYSCSGQQKTRREGSAAYLPFHAWHRDSGILSVSVAWLIDVKNIATNACAHMLTPASTLYAEFAIRASIVYYETAHNWLSIADVARITESDAAAV
jgi:hypothetical protein